MSTISKGIIMYVMEQSWSKDKTILTFWDNDKKKDEKAMDKMIKECKKKV